MTACSWSLRDITVIFIFSYFRWLQKVHLDPARCYMGRGFRGFYRIEWAIWDFEPPVVKNRPSFLWKILCFSEGCTLIIDEKIFYVALISLLSILTIWHFSCIPYYPRLPPESKSELRLPWFVIFFQSVFKFRVQREPFSRRGKKE